jgi:PAS domain S-box-containing protein
VIRNPLDRLGSVGAKVTWVIALVSAICVLVVAGWAGARSYRHLKDQSIETVVSQARIVAIYSSAAFAFWDEETAAETLSALRVVPGVEHAYLVDQRGYQLAAFSADGRPAAPGRLYPEGRTDTPGGYVFVVPVTDRAGVHGRLQVEVRNAGLKDEAWRAGLQFALLSLVALALGLMLARKLHPLLTRPILRLERAARRVRDTADFSTRVPVEGNDELARLADAFNEMLAQIQVHERAVLAAHREVADSKEQLQLATEAADVGLWDADLVADTLYWTPRVKAMFGISPEHEVTLDDFYRGLHPEDRERITRAFAKAMDPAARTLYDVEYRTVGRADGRIRWVTAKGRGVFDEEGRCVRIIGAVLDISARKAGEQALRESERQLRLSDRRKDEFLAMLAHELRNPLAPISTASTLLGRVHADPAKVQHIGELIGRQVRHMTALVDDLLDVSRVTRGLIELEPSDVELRSVLHAAVEQARPLVELRQHALEVDLPDADVWVRGDHTRLVQAIANLLNNAAKYTPPRGAVAVRLRRRDGSAVVEVEDSGIGIPEELLPHVFELFTQGERTPDRSQGGLGIGLALVRAIVELHGGTVAVRSDGSGTGACFSIVLPAIGRRTVAPASQRDARPGSARLRVLVADDNTDAADALGALLADVGHAVEVTYNGTAALSMAAKELFDVYILDIGLPDMTGYELIERIKTQGVGDDPLFIAATGYGQLNDRVASRAAGFDHHLVKPVDPAHLLGLLEAYAGEHATATRR